MLPFFGPEITPRRDFTGPVLKGSAEFESGAEPGLQVRALLEGQFLNMRLQSQWMEVKPERLRLTGGASKNDGIAQLAADVFQAPVERLDVSNSAALGAALIAVRATPSEEFVKQPMQKPTEQNAREEPPQTAHQTRHEFLPKC